MSRTFGQVVDGSTWTTTTDRAKGFFIASLLSTRPRGVTLISAGVLLVAMVVAVLGVATRGAAGVSSARRTPIQIENARKGTAGWSSGLFDSTAGSPTAAIQGYTSEVSTSPGGLIRLHVSLTPAQKYRVQVFRLGWYRGSYLRFAGRCRTSQRPRR